VPDPVAPSGEDAELRALVEQALQATYELGAEIGRGGMGIVYRARDRRLKRPVAIKLLPPELSYRRDVRTRFLREAETAAQLSHPNIVPIYSVDEIGSLVFFVMALVDGDNVARQLQQRGVLPVDQVRRWLVEMSEALAYAHARGVIHRDIKPDNILVDAIDGRAVVTDFGIARAATEGGDTARLTATGMAIGTPAYMSPEQASGDRDVDARSDLYSLGVVAYQMLCGQPPFTAGTMPALLVKHLAETPVPVSERRPDTPPDLAALVMRLLEKNPDHRVQQATEVAQAVRSGTAPLPRVTASATARSPIPLDGSPIGGMSLTGAAASPAPPAYQPPAYQPPAYQPAYQPPAYTANTGVLPAAGGGFPPAPVLAPAESGPTPVEVARWEAPPVVRFRKKLGPYLIVNSVILLLSLIGGIDLLGVTAIWTIALAFNYSKLWTEGFDWRDVLRQARHRELGDILNDFGEELEATFSQKKRDQLRARGHYGSGHPRTRDLLPLSVPSVTLPAPGTAPEALLAALAPPVQDAVRQLRMAQAEAARLYAAIPQGKRRGTPDPRDVAPVVHAGVAAVVRELAADAGRDLAAALAPVEAEIAALEAQANPMEAAASESRVRRLAQLRRDKRALRDVLDRQGHRLRQLRACTATLDGIRGHLVGWQAGTGAEAEAHADALAALVVQVAEEATALSRPLPAAAASA
jgi:serine/threonine-protein kinase